MCVRCVRRDEGGRSEPRRGGCRSSLGLRSIGESLRRQGHVYCHDGIQGSSRQRHRSSKGFPIPISQILELESTCVSAFWQYRLYQSPPKPGSRMISTVISRSPAEAEDR